jgi:DNA-binding Lrp family transcriptional regulator
MSEEEKKEEMEEVREEGEKGEFEILAEWTIRRLRPLDASSEDDYQEKVKRWILYSLGLDKITQDIFLYLEKAGRTTTTEVSSKFGMSPNTARKYLDDLHTIGFVDYVGREYNLTYESISRAIELMLIPRITDALRTISKGASSAEAPLKPSFREGITPGRVETVEYVSSMTLNRKILESWFKRGKRIRIDCSGSLTIESDIDPDLFEAVIERIECAGSLSIPSDLYAAVSEKIEVTGSIHIS